VSTVLDQHGWLQIYGRNEWRSVTPLGPKMTSLPVKKVFAHHSVTADTGVDEATFFANVKTIEKIGLQRFGRASYSFVLDRHLYRVAQMQGGNVGAHTGGHNSTAIGICTIGNFADGPYNEVEVNDVAITMARFLSWAIEHGVVDPAFELKPHNAVKATACPGVIADRLPWIREQAVNSVFGDSSYWRQWDAAPRPTPPAPPPPTPEPPTPTEGMTIRDVELYLTGIDAQIETLGRGLATAHSVIAGHTDQLGDLESDAAQGRRELTAILQDVTGHSASLAAIKKELSQLNRVTDEDIASAMVRLLGD